jgi:peptide/nickel transport system substrate-binding protein
MPGGLGRAAEMIQEQLKAIGLETRVNIVEYPQLADLCQFGNNRSQMHVFPSMYDLDPFMAVMENYTTLAPARNFTNYANPEIEALLARAEASSSTDEQRSIFYEIQAIVAHDVPHVMLFWKVFVDVARTNIGGFVMSNTSPNHNFRGIFMLED